MGKRSRKRDVPSRPSGAPRPAPAPQPAAPRTPRRKASLDELPPPPWAPFPLVELCVLLGLVLMGIGFIGGGDRRPTLIVAGVGLAAVAGLEQGIREHAAGFRSHTTMLAGVAAVALAIVTTLIGVPHEVALGIAVAGFGAAFYILRKVFAERSGGFGFRA